MAWQRMIADSRSTLGRAFVRSLNILLKFARLYGFEHARTIEQLDIAWRELREAIPTGTDNGLMLGATGSQLLLDGVPLEGAPVEKQFAQLLSAAGLASIQFFPSVTQEEIGRFARAFPTGKAKPTELARQLKATLTGAQGIRLNEICFVATDSRLKDASVAAQLAAASLGDQDDFKKWLNDPQKLLELIAAAQGSRGSGAVGTGTGAGGSVSESGESLPGSGGAGASGTGVAGGGTGGPGSGAGGGQGAYSGAPGEFSVSGSSTGGALGAGPYLAGGNIPGVAAQGSGPGLGPGFGAGPGGGPGNGGSGPWRGAKGSGPSED